MKKSGALIKRPWGAGGHSPSLPAQRLGPLTLSFRLGAERMVLTAFWIAETRASRRQGLWRSPCADADTRKRSLRFGNQGAPKPPKTPPYPELHRIGRAHV